jgi:hypothetical protein
VGRSADRQVKVDHVFPQQLHTAPPHPLLVTAVTAIARDAKRRAVQARRRRYKYLPPTNLDLSSFLSLALFAFVRSTPYILPNQNHANTLTVA